MIRFSSLKLSTEFESNNFQFPWRAQPQKFAWCLRCCQDNKKLRRLLMEILQNFCNSTGKLSVHHELLPSHCNKEMFDFIVQRVVGNELNECFKLCRCKKVELWNAKLALNDLHTLWSFESKINFWWNKMETMKMLQQWFWSSELKVQALSWVKCCSNNGKSGSAAKGAFIQCAINQN